MQKAVFILLLSFAVIGCVYAQNSIEVRGMVKDSLGTALSKATIRLCAAHDTLVTLTKEDGSFYFRLSEAMPFELIVTAKGYSSFRKIFASPSLILSPIILQAAYGELEPVTVMHVKPISVKEDTIEYHARAYKVHLGAELESLLRKLPGMQVDVDGSVTVQGKKITRVMVNGKDYPGDPLTVIRNFPVDIIDMVQVIDDYGDKARLTGVKSGESEKVLNVVLKKDKRNGQFGKAQLGAGAKNKYNVNLFTNSNKGGMQSTLNGWLRNISPTGNLYERGILLGNSTTYSEKWSGAGTVGLSGDHHAAETGMIQDIFLPGNSIHQEQNSLNAGDKNNLGANYTLKYTPDPNSTLRINPSLVISNESANSSNSSSILLQDSNFTKTTQGTSFNHSTIHSLSFGSEIYYEKLFPRARNRFAMQAVYQYTDKRQDQNNLYHTTIVSDNQTYLSREHYLLQSDNSSRNISSNLNYYIALGKSDFLELGYKWTNAATQNSLVTRVPDSIGVGSKPIDSLNNDFRSGTMTQRMHAGYGMNNEKINLSLSLDAQSLSQNGQIVDKQIKQGYHYFNILPTAEITYALSSERKLGFEYGANAAAPEFRQLQPVTDLSNPQNPVTGNPGLKPSFSQGFRLRYKEFREQPIWIQSLETELNYYTSMDLVIPVLLHPHDSSSVIQKTTYTNANGFSSISAVYYLHFPAFLHKRLRLGISGNFVDERRPVMTDNAVRNSKELTWGQGVGISLDIPEFLESDVAANYIAVVSRAGPGAPSITSSTLSWSVNNRHYLFQKWIFNYTVNQLFTNINNEKLFTYPALINGALEREFFKNNQAKLSLSVYDLFNSNTGIAQTATTTSISQSRTTLLGRYFMISLQLKLQNFRR